MSAHLPAFAKRLEELRQETTEVDPAVAGRRFLSVGGTGFLGEYLVEELLARGAAEVRILCRTPPADDPTRDPRITFATGSVTDAAVVSEACRDIDVVFHSAAAYGAPPFGRLGPGTAVHDINVGGVRNTLAAAREQGVSAYVYTSSTNVTFTGKDHWDMDEESSPYASGRKLDHYSRTKIEAEQLVLRANCAELRTASLRPNGIYGPREQYIIGKVLPLARKLRGLPFSLRSKQRTDWTFVYNLVWAHLLAVKRLGEAGDAMGGHAYYITDGGEPLHTMNDIILSFVRAFGFRGRFRIWVPTFLMVIGCVMMERLCYWLRRFQVTPPFTRTEALKAVVTETHSIERAQRELGYRPLFTTQEGLVHMNAELVVRVGVDKKK
ncbi:MAG: NAD-dependent epimerase/dehydratase family protein [bacterium]